jgi:hypothetical protein
VWTFCKVGDAGRANTAVADIIEMSCNAATIGWIVAQASLYQADNYASVAAVDCGGGSRRAVFSRLWR